MSKSVIKIQFRFWKTHSDWLINPSRAQIITSGKNSSVWLWRLRWNKNSTILSSSFVNRWVANTMIDAYFLGVLLHQKPGKQLQYSQPYPHYSAFFGNNFFRDIKKKNTFNKTWQTFNFHYKIISRNSDMNIW